MTTRNVLPSAWAAAGAQLERHIELESTMLRAAECARAGAREGTTVVAGGQSQGRGRRGRHWVSAPGAGLFMTTVLYPQDRARAFQLGLVAGLAAADAVVDLGVANAQLKWPNDIVVNGRKLGGMLLEAENEPVWHVRVGLGLNIAPRAALEAEAGGLEEAAPLYVGLRDVLDTPLSDAELVEALLSSTLHHLQRAYAGWQMSGLGAFLDRFAQRDALAGKAVRVLSLGDEASPLEGVARGLSADGGLQIEAADGLRVVIAGEVEQVRLNV